MTSLIVYSIGFIAQILFSLRFLIQWLKSEKKQKVVAPNSFWIFSLLASLLFFLYGYLRNDFSIMLGQILTYYIYIRNLQLLNAWKNKPIIIRYIFLFTPLLLLVYYISLTNTSNLFKHEDIPVNLLLLGIAAQVIFSLRFVCQWIYSEKNKSALFPLSFWLISCSGSLLILIYAIYRKDPVLFIGHSIGILIYLRNIILLKNYNSKLKIV